MTTALVTGGVLLALLLIGALVVYYFNVSPPHKKTIEAMAAARGLTLIDMHPAYFDQSKWAWYWAIYDTPLKYHVEFRTAEGATLQGFALVVPFTKPRVDWDALVAPAQTIQ